MERAEVAYTSLRVLGVLVVQKPPGYFAQKLEAAPRFANSARRSSIAV
jgi:hypothetical protein